MEKENKHAFVYVSDNNFAWIMGISMMSLLKHNPNAAIYILSNDITLENKQKLQDAAGQYGGKCSLIDIPDKYLKKDWSFRKWSSIVFVRLFVSQLLPDDVERAVYLDCDTLVLKDLSYLWEIDMQEHIFYGVKDCIGNIYRKNIGLEPENIYINAGVLLINMQLLQHFPIEERVAKFLKSHYYSNSYGDQDTINAVFKGRIGCLPLQYNVMSIAFRWPYRKLLLFRHPYGYYSEEEYDYGKRNPNIIHFTGHFWNVRPWYENSDHPYAEAFLEYKEASPWNSLKIRKKPSRGVKAQFIRFSMKVPGNFFLAIFGFFHSECYPRYKAVLQKIAGRKAEHDYF